jgi:hypothetical protein
MTIGAGPDILFGIRSEQNSEWGMEQEVQNFDSKAMSKLRQRRIPNPVVKAVIGHWVLEVVQEQADSSQDEADWITKAALILRWYKWQWLVNQSDPAMAAEIHDCFILIYDLLRMETKNVVHPLLHWISEGEFNQLSGDLGVMEDCLKTMPMPSEFSNPSSQDQPACRERSMWGSLRDAPATQKSHFWKLAT